MIHTYAVYERTTNKTNVIVARSEARAEELAKSHYNMPKSGLYKIVKIN